MMTFLSRLIERHRPEASHQLPALAPRLPWRFEPIAQAEGPRPLEQDIERMGDRLFERESRPTWSQAWEQPGPQEPSGPPQGSVPRINDWSSAFNAAPNTVERSESAVTSVRLATPSAPTASLETAPPIHPSAGAVPASIRVLPADRRVTALPAAPSIPAIIPRDLSPRSPSPPRQGHEREQDTSKAEPTVHVTIGRIEVRAVTPPVAPPSRSKETVQKLSLDDYLHGRTRAYR